MANQPVKSDKYNRPIAVQALSWRFLVQAISLINQEFPSQPAFEWAWLSLPLSLAPKPLLRFLGVRLSYLIAVDNSQVVGVSGLYSWRSQPDTCWVGWTVIAPAYRRQQLGSWLLQRVQQQAVINGYQSLKVYTVVGSGAEIFYQKKGFTKCHQDQARSFFTLKLIGHPLFERKKIR